MPLVSALVLNKSFGVHFIYLSRISILWHEILRFGPNCVKNILGTVIKALVHQLTGSYLKYGNFDFF